MEPERSASSRSRRAVERDDRQEAWGRQIEWCTCTATGWDVRASLGSGRDEGDAATGRAAAQGDDDVTGALTRDRKLRATAAENVDRAFHALGEVDFAEVVDRSWVVEGDVNSTD